MLLVSEQMCSALLLNSCCCRASNPGMFINLPSPARPAPGTAAVILNTKSCTLVKHKQQTINPLICMQSKCTHANSSLSSNPGMGKALSIIISKRNKSHSQLWCPGNIHISFYLPSPEKKKILFFIQTETVQCLGQTWQVKAKILCRPLI